MILQQKLEIDEESILQNCRFSARVVHKLLWEFEGNENLSDLVERLASEEVTRFTRIRPEARVVTRKEARKSKKIIVRIFAFSSRVKCDQYIYGTDVMLKGKNMRQWIQMSDRGKITFQKGSEPQISYGYYLDDQDGSGIDIVTGVENEKLLYLEL